MVDIIKTNFTSGTAQIWTDWSIFKMKLLKICFIGQFQVQFRFGKTGWCADPSCQRRFPRRRRSSDATRPRLPTEVQERRFRRAALLQTVGSQWARRSLLHQPKTLFANSIKKVIVLFSWLAKLFKYMIVLLIWLKISFKKVTPFSWLQNSFK